MTKEIIATPEAPEAVGAYSQATIGNGFVFCSGQIPLDPATGDMIAGSVADQTRRCLDNPVSYTHLTLPTTPYV